MPTDKERREVARKLRELPDDSTYPGLIGAIADHDGWYAAADAADRLADLIEPSCDREALLALEDEMFEDATGLALISQLEKNEELQDLQLTMAKALMGYSRRIRKALGVVDGQEP